MGSVPTLIQTLLIANRGEVACRIARTAWDLGVRTVGVFAPPDRGATHIRAVERAVEVPDYLDGDAIVAAALRTGADAVHPGFGFLAENAAFAQAVMDAGLIWVGPPPSAITAMGSKSEARAMMAAAGVPVLPGYDGAAQDDETLIEQANQIGFPIIVKPSAGGGGKGMIVVESAGEVPAALGEARRLAKTAFGDDRLILERYLGVARHIEVQVLADAHGNTLHLFERECSVQRRHQKVIEEAPSPAFVNDQAKRLTLCEHAVKAAEAVSYVGAGTVEFIVDGEGSAYFLEMNTRLQVEHPVTEMVTGLDIVALQLEVAGGAPLDFTQDEVRCDGWSIEARLYAEDPAQDFLPCTGTVLAWHEPQMDGVRVDAGVGNCVEVGIHYDPMLAKVIAHGPTREVANRRLQAGLERLVCLGVRNNRSYLQRVLAHPAFGAGALHTRFLEEHREALSGVPQDGSEEVANAVAAAVVHDWMSARDTGRPMPALRANWRNNRWRDPTRSYTLDGASIDVSWQDRGNHLVIDGRVVRLLQAGPPYHLEIDGVATRATVAASGRRIWVHLGQLDVELERVPDFVDPAADLGGGGCVASMPGKIVQVLVSVGDAVEAGTPLVVMEAMKMEQTLSASEAGTVAAIQVAPGDQVDLGATLISIDVPE